jgi:hypothetical protein
MNNGVCAIIAILIPVLMAVSGLIYIIINYIIPNKSIKGGIKEWWHESDDDFISTKYTRK